MSTHFLSLAALDQDQFIELITRAAMLARQAHTVKQRLAARSVGLLFTVTSTRTRTSFATAAAHMGATPLTFGNSDLQLNTGESWEDTLRVLSGYLSALIVRAPISTHDLSRLAAVAKMPVINAMNADEHPSQAISDIAMMLRHFRSHVGRRMLYMGEGNSTAAALALAASRLEGFEACFATPKGYGLTAQIQTDVRRLSQQYGGCVRETHDVNELKGPFDILYATRWQTTATSKSDPYWREVFSPFRVTQTHFSSLRRDSDSVFMHDLPAVRDEDCDGQLLDGPHSIAFAQAHQKLYTAMAIYDVCI